MLLMNAQVENFRSIDNSTAVAIDPKVTVLVGQNESGKTGFLQALNFCRPVEQNGGFDMDRDYPRKGVNEYRARHETKPAVVVTLTYEATQQELDTINRHLGTPLLTSLWVSTTHHYKNNYTIGIEVEEAPYIQHLLDGATLPAEVKVEAARETSVRSLLKLLLEKDLNDEGKEFVAALTKRFKPELTKWQNLLEYEIWNEYLKGWLPKFFYFDDYYLLPGKVNLKTLSERAVNKSQQSEEDKTVLSLLQLAGVNLHELTTPQGYEQIKSRLEGLQNSITDRIFEYWTQNQELEVEFDIREDPKDRAPFNQGANLYIRIKNRRHRVTVPFSQRSKGFIWFFSFIVWFDTIKRQLGESDDLVLLLDEPGLSLHALAQRDFLRYIDALAEKKHQIVYTTHSPFMVHSDRFHQVRMVEDRKDKGTVVTSKLSGSDPKTLFPLQAALGYTVAQNLFISKRNLLVEGPGDLVYLRFFATALEAAGRTGLRDDITVVPTGGLDKLATFIALLGANRLEMVVVHDWAAKSDPHLDSLVRDKLIKDKLVLNYGQFRGVTAKARPSTPVVVPPPATDVEDLFSVPFYLKLFNGTFKKQLVGEVSEADLPPGDRLIDRLNRYLTAKDITLRPSGGFNHYAVANHLAASPPKTLDKDTLSRFEALFAKVNSLFSANEVRTSSDHNLAALVSS